MQARELLNLLTVAERLKDTTRHCYTSKGRRESVAEHSWMMTLMVFFMRDEFPEADMDKVIRMCIIHDLGEAFTGDIPAFEKTAEDEKKEEELLYDWVKKYNPDAIYIKPYHKLRPIPQKHIDRLNPVGELSEEQNEGYY